MYICIFFRQIFLLFLLFIFFKSNAQEVVTGPQFRGATMNSIDILSSHLVLQQAQSQYNQVLNNVSFTNNFAPVRFYFNDGSIENGRISRRQINACFGYGNTDKIGAYGGIQINMIGEILSQKKVINEGTGNTLFQNLAYIGIAFLDFQLDIGTTFTQGFHLDGNYDFTKNKNEVPFDNSPLFRSGGTTIYSLYHKTGVSATAIFSEEEYNPMYAQSNKKHLSEFRINLQPLKKYLPAVFGLPFIDLTSHTPLNSYYNESTGYYSTVKNIDTETTKKKNYDFMPGSDNLFEKGIRASVAIQAYPKVRFKKVELGYNYLKNKDKMIFGIRTQLFNNNGKADLGFDSFIMLSALKKILNLSLSYSYNSPQNITFLPLPKLHVIGIQIIIGKRETAKAIIPFAASILADEYKSNVQENVKPEKIIKENNKTCKSWINKVKRNKVDKEIAREFANTQAELMIEIKAVINTDKELEKAIRKELEKWNMLLMELNELLKK